MSSGVSCLIVPTRRSCCDSGTGGTTLLLVLIMALTCLERLYSPDQESGVYNRYIYVAYVLIEAGIVVAYAGSVKFELCDMAFVVAAGYFLVWNYSYRAMLYSVIAIAIMLTCKMRVGNLLVFHRALVIMGLVSCLVFSAGEQARWSGFFTTSAPVFSLVMLVSMTYLLFHPRRVAIDTVLAFVACVLIAQTQTRITLLVGIAFLIVRFAEPMVNRITKLLAEHRAIALVLFVSVVVVVASNVDSILGLVPRGNGADSTSTRIGLMSIAMNDWLASPVAFLFGNGGGYAMWHIADLHPAYVGHLPVHQDVLMILCDYGLVGLGLLLLGFAHYLRYWPWQCVMFLAMATFHNVFTSGTTFLVMLISFQSIAQEKDSFRACGGALNA